MNIIKAIFDYIKYKDIGFDWKHFKITAKDKRWTLAEAEDMECLHGLDVEEELIKSLTQEITIKEEDMSNQLIGICGLIGSGKDTVGQILVDEYGFTKISFAGTLKDMTAVLFDWDRDMLEGTTPETRAAREILDPFWSDKLRRDWSPRIALQQMGTEVIRNHLNNDMWIHTVENKIRKLDKVVITDCRFPNEIDFVKKHGEVWVIDRGPQPAWWDSAVRFNYPVDHDTRRIMHDLGTTPDQLGVHASEYSWAGVDATEELDNNGSIQDLVTKVSSLV